MRIGTLILVLFFLSPRVSVASDLSGSLDDIAKGMTTYFPKVTGTVVEVGPEAIEIAMSDGGGVVKGVLLSVYRKGDPFYHPVTGVALGHFEEEVALLEGVTFERQRVTARLLDPTKVLVPGDFVRLTKARIPMGVLPPTHKHNEGLVRAFMRALEETGRFAPTLLPSNSLHETASPFYGVTFETATDQPDTVSPTVHVRLENVKTQTVLFDVHVDLAPVAGSDFIMESLQRLHFEKYPR